MKLSPKYVAGFIDGEGYLGIICKINQRSSTLGYYYTPVIKITQTESANEILYLIKNKYGGNLTKSGVQTKRRKFLTLEFRGSKRVRKLLKDIQPYLIVKSKQADILAKYLKLKTRITEQNRLIIDATRTKLYQQILTLNKRGLAETKRKEPVMSRYAIVRAARIQEGAD